MKRNSLKEIAIKMTSVVVVHLVALLCVNFINTNMMYSNKNLYYNIHIPKVTANRMGLLTTMRLDLQRFIFGFEEKLSVETSTTPIEEEENSYNVTYIDFDKLIQNEENNTIKEMHEYFSHKRQAKKINIQECLKEKI